jgi:hypothetical protein
VGQGVGMISTILLALAGPLPLKLFR